jgi:putative FmdB family regulatory protein
VPIFEYTCEACGTPHEVIVLPPELPPEACPACGGALRRRWSRVGVQLVGWDFARNDALLPTDRPRKPFRKIRDKAAELFD